MFRLGCRLRVRSDVTLLVVGLLIGYFASGLVGIMVYLSAPESIQRYLLWTFGSFTATTWPTLGLLALAVSLGGSIAFYSPNQWMPFYWERTTPNPWE